MCLLIMNLILFHESLYFESKVKLRRTNENQLFLLAPNEGLLLVVNIETDYSLSV